MSLNIENKKQHCFIATAHALRIELLDRPLLTVNKCRADNLRSFGIERKKNLAFQKSENKQKSGLH